MVEKAWNCFPVARTEISHPSFSKFRIHIETINVLAERGSDGKLIFPDNVLPYTADELKKRKIRVVDIADNKDVDAGAYSAATDPQLVSSKKAGRGPLRENWFNQASGPCMVAYRKVVIECSYFGISRTVEDYLEGYENGLFKNTHRKLFSWMDEWYGLTEQQIRDLEKQMNQDMNRRMKLATGSTATTAAAEAEAGLTAAELDAEHPDVPAPDAA